MPKAEFMQSEPFMKAHRNMVDAEVFQRGIKTAMAQYTRVMCQIAPSSMDSPNQLQASAMCFQRIQGANDFLNILLNLAETPAIPTKRDPDNLTQ